jgi:hypothetical protein
MTKLYSPPATILENDAVALTAKAAMYCILPSAKLKLGVDEDATVFTALTWVAVNVLAPVVARVAEAGIVVPLILVELDSAAGRLAAGSVPLTAPEAPNATAPNDGYELEPPDTKASPEVEDGVMPSIVVLETNAPI